MMMMMCYPSVALRVPDTEALIDDHCHCTAFQNEVQRWPQTHKLRRMLLTNCSDQHELCGKSSETNQRSKSILTGLAMRGDG